MSVLLVVKHDVEDFDSWLKGYKEAGNEQSRLGVKDESVHRLPDQPNTVLVLHSFDSLAAANAFMADPGVGELMKNLGVLSEPRVEIYETVESV